MVRQRHLATSGTRGQLNPWQLHSVTMNIVVYDGRHQKLFQKSGLRQLRSLSGHCEMPMMTCGGKRLLHWGRSGTFGLSTHSFSCSVMKTGLSRAMPLLLLVHSVNLQLLHSFAPSVRAMEIFDGVLLSHLGKIRDQRAIEPLIRALADKYENVRAESASSLASIGKPALGPLLHFLRFSEGPLRLEVVNTLGELHDTDAIQPLMQMLWDADEGERKAIADALDAILIPTVEPLVRELRNGSHQKAEKIRSENNEGEG